MGITEFLAGYITAFIGKAGYLSVTVLMTLESMVAPVPSEAVMPFAGFLISDGKFTFQAVLFYSTLGSIIGSLVSYTAGYYLGKPFVKKFGKYLLLNLHHLEITEKFFRRYGDITIFISRFIPVVRHLISIPGGVGRMSVVKFSLYTVAGAGLWNAFLAYTGYLLRNNWAVVMKYSRVADIIILTVILFAIIYLFYRFLAKKGRQRFR